MVVVGQKLLYSGKSDSIRAKKGCIRAKWLYSVQSGCIPAILLYAGKVVLFGQKWFYSGKSGFCRKNMVVFGYKLLYSGKDIVIGQDGCVRAKWFFWNKIEIIRANNFYSWKEVVFGQKLLHSGKMVVFGQSGCNRAKWLFSVKSGCIRAKWL